MTTLADLLTALDALFDIQATRQVLQLNSYTTERAYEAYVLALCRKAVLKAGGTTVIKGINSGENPSTVVFRGAPGSMGSKLQDFCYVQCELKGKVFEIHVDVEYQGQSGATHEIDVSMYESKAAAQTRKAGSLPRATKCLITSIECKFYSGAPPISMARAFVGLASDCTATKFKAFASNKTSSNIERYLSKQNSPHLFVPLSPLDSEVEERFIRVVEHALRTWAASR